jgi:ATP-binding cassette subfamily G (WHITE) protein 2
MFFVGTGMIFSALGPLVTICNCCWFIQLVPIEREIFLKEENSKCYTIFPYFFGKMVIELPFAIVTAFISATIIYYSCGLINEPANYLWFTLICILVSLCGNGLGLFTGSLFSNARQSSALAPIVLLPLQIFSGIYANLGTIPAWISWFQYISVMNK